MFEKILVSSFLTHSGGKLGVSQKPPHDCVFMCMVHVCGIF